MRSFWPDDINAKEILSPTAILNAAGEELHRRTNTLIHQIQETIADDRCVLAFHVTNQLTSLTLSLFEVAHRVSIPYPVRIYPPTSDIPEFLQKRRFVPDDSLDPFEALRPTPGGWVTEEWVCSTPEEFEGKLKELFSREDIKSRIVSLQAMQNNPATPGTEGDQESNGAPNGGPEQPN